MNEKIIERIRSRIEALGLTPELVAIDAGMSMIDLQHVRSGKRGLRATELVSLCQLLGLTLEDFTDGPATRKAVAVRSEALMRELARRPGGVRKAIDAIGNFVPAELTPEQAIRIHDAVIPSYPLDWLLIYDGNRQFERA